jgi:hypothetical protein
MTSVEGDIYEEMDITQYGYATAGGNGGLRLA